MSLETEDQWPPQHSVDANHEFQKKDKVSYSRDFLLSLSELDACKNLPSGIDLSVLSEINNASNNLQDRKRVPGSFSSQSFRCGEYGSSPPTRGDLSSYSRGIYGRWDGRSNGRLDGDSDNNSDWNAESGKRFGYQSRRSWKTPEHDGLLGSGSLPRPSECADASKVRAHDNCQLNQSSEPYHPPRPYKAVSHPAKEAKDSYNDETFGSSNCGSQDRAEEERRRRDSFELMRKQQKALLEKQKLNPDQNKGKLVSDISYLLEDSNDNKEITNVDNALDRSQIEPGPPNFLGKSHYPLKASASRPLVPPGFTSGVMGMNFETRSSSQSIIEEVVDDIKHQEQPLNAVDNPTLGVASVNHVPKQLVLNADCRKQEGGTMDLHAQHVDNGENIMKSSSSLEVTNELNRLNDESYNSLRVLEPFDTLKDGDIINLDSEKGSGHGIGGALSQEQSTSALEKLFGIASMINDGGRSRLLQNDNIDEGVIWSPKTTKGSRFSHWFLEEEKKALDDNSSSRPSDLFSLIVGGDNLGNSHMSTGVLSSTVEISEHMCSGVKPDGVAAVLRCEDLEKSILSEASENGTNLHPSIQDLGIIDANAKQPSGSADDHASWHLLSLLQKGPALQEIAPSSDRGMAQKSEQQKTVKDNDSSQGGQTLESLFGSAFMKELQDSVGSARIDGGEAHGLPSSMVDDGAVHFQTGVGLESKSFVAEERLLGISSCLPFTNATGASQLPWLPNACVGISEQLPFQCNPYTLHPQSSPQFITTMNRGRPEFHSLDSRFPRGLLPDQIHGNMVRPVLGHPSARVSGFDHQNHHHAFDQMLMRGHSPHDLVQGLARNRVMGFVEESGMLHGFPYGRQDLSLCIPGTSLPGGDVGGVGNNQPELLQRLLGMEPGSEPKQAGRFPTTGGVYSDELEAGFRY